MSRAQIQEILERNARLHKNDASFVPYLVELAMYLLEYEYDWRESGTKPPDLVLAQDKPKSVVNGLDQKQKPAAIGVVKTPTGAGSRPKIRSYGKINQAATPREGEHSCPHCGTMVSTDELICPSCRNLTK